MASSIPQTSNTQAPAPVPTPAQQVAKPVFRDYASI